MKIPFFSRKPFFTPGESQQIVHAIQLAEKQTSGEIRLYVESRCRFVDPLDRAAEVFVALKMHETQEHNAVLIYVAMKDRQLAILGDSGIHEKVGTQFWNAQLQTMLSHFGEEKYSTGLEKIIGHIGEALHANFPYNDATDKNELPDDIVFGR